MASNRLKSSEKASKNQLLRQLHFPKNSIVKLILAKGKKPTIISSKKLLPDVSSFHRVLRTGPSNLELENLSYSTIRTVKNTTANQVSYRENQKAIQLIKDNFPTSLLWTHSHFHGQHNPRPYITVNTLLSGQSEHKKNVTFSGDSEFILIPDLIQI